MNCECGCGQPASTGRRFVVGHNMVAEDLSGKTFGKRTVIGPAHKEGTHLKWRCLCECGFESFLVKSKIVKAEGCRHCNSVSKKRPFESLYNLLCLMAKGRCTVNLTYEEYLQFTSIPTCHYCGVNITWQPHGSNEHGHHLDRKDNAIGYSKGNCVVCCGPCNQIKSNRFTCEQMLQIGALIKSWHT